MAQKIPTLYKETKFFDTAIEDDEIDNSGDWITAIVSCATRVNENGTTISTYTDSALIPSAKGAGYGQIIGNQYNLLGLSIRGQIHCVKSITKADVNKSIIVRLVLVLDTQSRGFQAGGEFLLTDWGFANSLIHSYLAMGHRPGRFILLDDQFHVIQHTNAVVDDTATISYAGQTKQFQMDWKPARSRIVTLTDRTGASMPDHTGLNNTNIFLLALHTSNDNNLFLSACCRAYYCG